MRRKILGLNRGKFEGSKRNPYKAPLKYSTERTWNYPTNITAKTALFIVTAMQSNCFQNTCQPH